MPRDGELTKSATGPSLKRLYVRLHFLVFMITKEALVKAFCPTGKNPNTEENVSFNYIIQILD